VVGVVSADAEELPNVDGIRALGERDFHAKRKGEGVMSGNG
jgi:hypothetical protein